MVQLERSCEQSCHTKRRFKPSQNQSGVSVGLHAGFANGDVAAGVTGSDATGVAGSAETAKATSEVQVDALQTASQFLQVPGAGRATSVTGIAGGTGRFARGDNDFFTDGNVAGLTGSDATGIACGPTAAEAVQTASQLVQAGDAGSTTGVTGIARGTGRFADGDGAGLTGCDATGIARSAKATKTTTEVQVDVVNSVHETANATLTTATGVTRIADGNVGTRLTRRDYGTRVTGTRTNALEDTGISCNRAANYEQDSEEKNTSAFHVETSISEIKYIAHTSKIKLFAGPSRGSDVTNELRCRRDR